MTRLQKVAAATGVAAVGATALGFAVAPGQGTSEARTAASEMPAQSVFWQAAAESPVRQKAGIDAQTSHARDAAEKQAKAEAQEQAEAEQRAAAAKAAAGAAAKAKAEEARRAAQKRREAREKAEEERREQQAASRSAQRSESVVPSGSPKEIAREMIGDEAQFQCFSHIVEHESGWDPRATNPSSGAYGLVQALPGSKMASAGADWQTNPATQIKWGLEYMNDRYGSPCGAWDFWQANNWY